MWSKSATLAVLAGCWQSSTTPIGNDPVAVPRTPAPKVAWEPYSPDAIGRGIVTTGLPAVARDGAVVFAQEDGDGPRGNPNLVLVLRAREDRLIEQFRVIDPNEVDAMPEATLRQHFAAANDYLGKLHATRAFAPMVVWPEPKFDTAGAPHSASDGTLAVEWRNGHLHITDGTAVVVDRATPKAWLAEDRPMYAGAAEICQNPAFLAGVAVDRAAKVALVTISYEGTDTCPEPPSQRHVVAW